MKTINSKGLAALCLITVIWAYHWIVMKSALQYIGAIDYTMLRALVAFFVLLLLMKCLNYNIKPTAFLPTMLIGLFQTTGMTGLSQLALLAGASGKVSILTYTMPFWLMMLSMIFLKEKMTRIQSVAFVLAIIGLIFMIQPWNIENTLMSSLLAVCSGLCWAIGSVITKQFYARYCDVPTLSLTTWQMGYGTIWLIGLSFIIGEHHIIWSLELGFALFYSVILATALGWLLWLYILRCMPAGIAGLSTLAIPALATLFGWFIFNEKLNSYDLIGLILIIAGLLLLNYKRSAKVEKIR